MDAVERGPRHPVADQRDLETGKETLIASDPKADAGGIIFNLDTYQVEAVAFNREPRPLEAVLDPAVADDLRDVPEGGRGRAGRLPAPTALQEVDAYSADVTLTTTTSTTATKKLTKLFAANLPLVKYTLGVDEAGDHQEPRRAGDGQLPDTAGRGRAEAAADGNAGLVHGGPWARDSWGLRRAAQWLANRGYAALQVNFRGSTGLGKKFLHAGDREWGRKMHDDLIDAVRWAIDQDTPTRRRWRSWAAAMAGMPLAGAAFTPDTFTCAVSVVGLSVQPRHR
ncbi:MAG: prolyl oligopeptidase family serine peptidase [Gemmataceae bacterium]